MHVLVATLINGRQEFRTSGSKAQGAHTARDAGLARATASWPCIQACASSGIMKRTPAHQATSFQAVVTEHGGYVMSIILPTAGRRQSMTGPGPRDAGPQVVPSVQLTGD